MILRDENESFDEWDMPDDALSAVVPDERIGAPLPNRRRKRLARVAAALLLAGAAIATSTSWPGWYGAMSERIAALATASADAPLDRAARDTSRPLPPVSESRAGSAPPEPKAASPEPIPQGEADLPPRSVSETPPIAATAYISEAPPTLEASDESAPRARATKAGLGPDLPNVLLSRLSKADLENAAYAIQTAIRKTPETATLKWPPKPSPADALFEVRFVPGAPDGCRRYVVTVTKEHWSTTSGAVKKCKEDDHH